MIPSCQPGHAIRAIPVGRIERCTTRYLQGHPRPVVAHLVGKAHFVGKAWPQDATERLAAVLEGLAEPPARRRRR